MDLLVILNVVIGVSLVIFVHELGHFAVAKWAGVKVERFSIGFPMPNVGWKAIPVGAITGIVIKGREAFESGNFTMLALWLLGGGVAGLLAMLLGKIGLLKLYTDSDETEYVLGFIPIGGYVKMLGENPDEQNEETKVDPRSYGAQPVYKRMAIISAGVVMNVIFAFLWFVAAYNMGVSYTPTIVRKVIPGLPAWKAGLGPGDEILQINNRRDLSFRVLTSVVALSDPNDGGIHLKGTKASGEPFEMTLVPDAGEVFPVIGVLRQSDTRLAKTDPVVKGMASADATPPFEPSDRIIAIDGQKIRHFADLESALDRARGDTITIRVERAESESDDGQPLKVDIEVGPNHFRTLGIRTQMGEIVAIKNNSPVVDILQEGDIITHVNGREIGKDIDPLRLPDELFTLAGSETRLTVKRRNEEEPINVKVTPEPHSGWSERPIRAGDPLPAPALGIVYRVIPVVLAVEPGSPADKAGIRPTDRIEAIQILSDDGPSRPLPLKGDDEKNWPSAFWLIQQYPTAKVKLTLSGADKSAEKVVELMPEKDRSWPLPMRGLSFQPLTKERKTASLVAAARLGVYDTWDSMAQVSLMLRGMFSGQISPKALGGPISIFVAAEASAQRGVADLLVFLALFSANLAVLNFLPIPVLDGGHMVFLLWEAVRGKPADERAMIVANYVGLAMILSLMLYVVVLDVNRWFIP